MTRKTAKTICAVAAALLGVIAAPAHAGKTLDAIKARGQLVCGVNTGLAGFSAADSQGNWTGLDVDVCKAIAAAILSDANKVKWVPLNAQQRFTALQSGEIDILSRNTTWTLTRDASLGMNFTNTTYYDGQGFMVPSKGKIKSAKQLKGATVCVQTGTTTEKNLTDFSRANNLATSSRWCSTSSRPPTPPTSRAGARPIPPTPPAWPPCGPRKPRTRKST